MKVLLVNPARLAPADRKYVTLPYGLLYIAAVLEKAGHDVKIYDCNIDSRQPSDFTELVESPYVV